MFPHFLQFAAFLATLLLGASPTQDAPWICSKNYGSVESARAEQGTAAEFNISGTILDEDSKPIRNAAVRLLQMSPAGWVEAAQAPSGENGKFTVAGNVKWWTRWRVEAASPGFATSMVDKLYLKREPCNVGLIYLYKPVVVRGTVSRAGGLPVANVNIYHAPGIVECWDGAAYEPVARTDASGHYEFLAAPGICSIGAEASGYADSVGTRILVKSPGIEPVDFLLDPSFRFRCHVTMEDGSKATEGRVELGGCPDGWGEAGKEKGGFWRREIIINKNGDFFIDGIRSIKDVSIQIRAAGASSQFVKSGELRSKRNFIVKSAPTYLVHAERSGASTPPEIDSVDLMYSGRRIGFYCAQNTEHGERNDIIDRVARNDWRVRYVASASKEGDGPPDCIVTKTTDGAASEEIKLNLKNWRGGPIPVNVTFPRTISVGGRFLDPSGGPIFGAKVGLQYQSGAVRRRHIQSPTRRAILHFQTSAGVSSQSFCARENCYFSGISKLQITTSMISRSWRAAGRFSTESS